MAETWERASPKGSSVYYQTGCVSPGPFRVAPSASPVNRVVLVYLLVLSHQTLVITPPQHMAHSP